MTDAVGRRWSAPRPRTSTSTSAARRRRSAASSCCRCRTPDGKLTPELVDLEARGFDDEHRAQPQVVCITQTTELGTGYSVDEIRAVVRARARARACGCTWTAPGSPTPRRRSACRCGRSPPTSASTCCRFGGTKNGLLLGEVVVVLNPDAAPGVDYLRKSSMQLASKMRFVSAQFEALLGADLWLRSATHANAMARRLDGGRARHRRCPGAAAGPGQRGLRGAARGGDRPAAEEVPLLHVGRGDRRGALDDAPSTPPTRTSTRSPRPSARRWQPADRRVHPRRARLLTRETVTPPRP